tara:strand:+ start:281 stop:1021 length:741 start_codon:yes stop_codon:yes gene_type:complete
MIEKYEMIKLIKWVSINGLKRIYENEIARDYNKETLYKKLNELICHGGYKDVYNNYSYLDTFGVEEYYEENELNFNLLRVIIDKTLYDGRAWDPWDFLDDSMLDDFFQELREDFDWIGRIEDYMWSEHFITKDQERKEMDARGVIYRACFKAYWNPHCKIGKKMVENRYNKMLEIGSEDDDDDCICNYGMPHCKSSKCEDKEEEELNKKDLHVTGIKCNRCNMYLPVMKESEFLDITNPLLECPHR